MRRQLRPFYTDEQLAKIYDHAYDHTCWPDHLERVARTVQVLDDFAAVTDSRTVADLSCGDGAIVGQSRHPWVEHHLDDFTRGGPIETTIEALPAVDMFVCSETLEHIEGPDELLAKIRGKARHLLLSTPYGEDDDANPQHYWGWDADDLQAMLKSAGWIDVAVELFTPASVDYYTFQIWRCS